MDVPVNNIVQKVFGAHPSLIEEIKGKGKNNLVFKIVVNKISVILRLNASEQVFELYKKEKWCADLAASSGVPTPKILEVGILEGHAYSFQEFVEGIRGTDDVGNLGKTWFALGQLASLINKIPAPSLSLDYKKFIWDIFANDYFVARNIFSQELSVKIQNRLSETTTWEFLPTLCHGNLHPNNTIIDPVGTVHIIDWETATGNKTPTSELAEIYTWNTGKENVAHFLNGYGLKEKEVKGMMRDIQTLVLLRLVHVIARKMPKNNDWGQDAYIKETATRLTAIGDYEQDILFTKNL